MKRSFLSSLVLIALLFSSLSGLVYAEEPQNPKTEIKSFSDTKGHWAEGAIKTAVAKGYVSGYTDGTFKPNAEVTRAEFLKMLVAALKLETVATSGNWYQPYIDAATKSGFYANDFKSDSWNKSIPRKEMSLLAVRAGITGYKKDYDINRNLYEAAKAGVIQGVGNGEIAPDGVTTRASAVVVIERILDIKARKTLPSDKYATGAAEILWHKTNIMTMLPRYFSNSDEQFNSAYLSATYNKLADYTTDLIVVDLNDKNDPNKKLITSDLRWGRHPNYYEIKDVNAYALLSVTKIKVNGNSSETHVRAPYIELDNDDWKKTFGNDTRDINTKNPNTYYSIFPWWKEYGVVKMAVDLKSNNGKTFTFVKGQIIPKGNFNSDKQFTLTYVKMGWTDGAVVYRSKIDTNYNQ
ncbi:S-layer homology domain-containing protein [Paenibacillus sp. GCM10012307]|uniref:S-layer homology domain-containing protein n=1 Tax=Paenibacillus roseus TaxID=2798579 RepID=A0A934MQ72_9BACL|nr:S-layer homology domain-containing protein [Paenibacillus roseus]MBJ6361104.1 S-layer homology domain-containing protein [Paenibacillus roseus]